MSETNIFNSETYKTLKASIEGKALIKQSEAEAADFMFDLKSGSKNEEVAKIFNSNDIYNAVTMSSSLTFTINGSTYSIEPYYSQLDEETALEMLQDMQSSLETSLLSACIESKQVQQVTQNKELLFTLLSDVMSYVAEDELPCFKEWVYENEPDLRPKIPSDDFNRVLSELLAYTSSDDDDVWEFAKNIDLNADASVDRKVHIYTKIVQLEELIKEEFRLKEKS